MQTPDNSSLVHEATSLFRLVDSIDRFVAEHEHLFAYTEATQRFFQEIHFHAESTKTRVASIIDGLVNTPGESEPRYQRDLIIQKGRWRTLHTYIKPATDAHTLNVPVPLVEMATQHLNQVPGIKETAIAVLLTPELMYYHNTPQERFRSERDFVFVEVPYSQGPSFFANLTIYHELGHYVFQTLKESAAPLPAFSSLAAAMETAYADKLSPLKTAGTTTWAKGVLDAWTNEIFCDLFALRHLGPAFSFALIDFLSLIGLMGEETEATFDK